MGHYFEDLKPGMSARLVKTVSERDIELFGEVSGDRNPIHFDEDYAKGTMFRGRIAHGVIAISYISNVLGNQLPGPGTIFISATTRFKAPVRIGDTVETVCTVRELLERRRVAFDCICTVNGTVVVEGDTLVLAPSRPKA